MSKRYRIAAIAFGLLIFASLFLYGVWGWQSFQAYKSQHTEKRQSATNYQAETADQYADICFKEDNSIFVALKCVINSIDAHRSAQRSHYDLQAQQEMAEWAYGLILISIAGLFISIAGLTAIFTSLAQTRTAIKDTRNIGYHQLRAYVTVSKVTGHIIQKTKATIFDIEVVFRNSGQTPAQKVMQRIEIDLSPRPKLQAIKTLGFVGLSSTKLALDIVPRGDSVLQYKFSIPVNWLGAGVKNGMVVLRGNHKYTDYAGEEHSEDFIVKTREGITAGPIEFGPPKRPVGRA